VKRNRSEVWKRRNEVKERSRGKRSWRDLSPNLDARLDSFLNATSTTTHLLLIISRKMLDEVIDAGLDMHMFHLFPL
jgi:hypothetical protein